MLYSKKFFWASFNSYENHYRAATRPIRPNKISADRMNWVVEAVALQRLKGVEDPDDTPALPRY